MISGSLDYQMSSHILTRKQFKSGVSNIDLDFHIFSILHILFLQFKLKE